MHNLSMNTYINIHCIENIHCLSTHFLYLIISHHFKSYPIILDLFFNSERWTLRWMVHHIVGMQMNLFWSMDGNNRLVSSQCGATFMSTRFVACLCTTKNRLDSSERMTVGAWHCLPYLTVHGAEKRPVAME